MEEEALLVLFDLRGHVEEGQPDGRGRGLRAHGVLQSLRASGMVQGIGRPGKQQTHRMGQEGGRRGAIAAQVALDRLDGIFAIAPSALEVLVEHLGCGRVQRRDDKTRIIPRAHDFCLEHDPPRLCPGLCRIGALVREATAGRRRWAMALRQSHPGLMQTPRFLHDRGGLAE